MLFFETTNIEIDGSVDPSGDDGGSRRSRCSMKSQAMQVETHGFGTDLDPPSGHENR